MLAFVTTVHVLLQPSGFSTGDALERTVRVAEGASESVAWDLSTTAAGQQSLVAKAWIEGGPTDGVRQNVEVQAHARELHYKGAGEIVGGASVQIVKRNDADPAAGGVKITLSPTIGTALYGALDSLIGYPYGCVEQTMSRFLPAMVVGRSVEALGVLRPDLKKKIPEIASRSFAKLEEMQHPDGGWGWWTYDQSEPFMTAYVLDGLHEASAAGYDPNPFLRDRALEWAVQFPDALSAAAYAGNQFLPVLLVGPDGGPNSVLSWAGAHRSWRRGGGQPAP